MPSNIRPASFRLRKAVFDILMSAVKGKTVLDLFGGSGALGIEALSLGAREVVFVDAKRDCVNVITRNLSAIKKVSSCSVFLRDSLQAVKSFSSRNNLFDIIFIDPPYYGGMVKKVLKTLSEYDILAPLGYLVVLCYRSDEFKDAYKRGVLVYNRTYGQSRILVYAKP